MVWNPASLAWRLSLSVANLSAQTTVSLVFLAVRIVVTSFGVAAGMSLCICLMGFAGGLVMSAIKRDRGVKDFGSLIEGHGGMLDRIDSVCFAAPVFFHLTRYFFAQG